MGQGKQFSVIKQFITPVDCGYFITFRRKKKNQKRKEKESIGEKV